MYKNSKNNNKTDLISYIYDSDIYNSKFIKKLKDSNIETRTLKLSKYDTRLDIVSKNSYGNYESESFLSLLNPEFKKTDESIQVPTSMDTLLGLV